MSSARPQDYAEAFTKAHLEGGVSDDVLIARLFASVKRNNDIRKLSAIARAVGMKLTRKAGGDDITITSARALSEHQQSAFVKTLKKNDAIHFDIDPALHAGVRINKNGEEELDTSLARKIARLFS